MNTFYLLGLLLAAPAFATVNCYNKDTTGKTPLIFAMDEDEATLSWGKAQCEMEKIDYNPVSARYTGWIRFGSDKRNCPELGKALFGTSDVGKDPIEIYWFSVSTEVQKGKEGFAQLGYQNDADPGAGAEAKLNVRCFEPPKKRKK